MKKLLPICIVGILLCTGFGAAALQSDLKANDGINKGDRDYTHTVLVEVGTAQWCGPCASWNTAIYNTYNTGSYDFEYVEMIYSDTNHNVLNNQAYSWINYYDPTYIPASIFDGDYQRLEGNYPAQLPGALDACGQRTVKDIDASIILNWFGNATIFIEISITNNEQTQYNGHIRVPISEILSRYDTATGTQYHHGFLDYAFPMNQGITIAPGETYTNSITWVGGDHQDNHGDNFGDITPDNIQVILGVLNDVDNYVDETAVATIGGVYPPSNPNPNNGATNVDVNSELSWTGGPGTSITYDVFFGTTSPPPKVSSNQSATVYDPGTLAYSTIYYWKIVAWGENDTASGPLWHFSTMAIPNDPPNNPTITGPNKGKPQSSYKYTITGTDNDSDMVSAYIVWGDDTITDWTAFYDSGEAFPMTHTWTEKGTYTVQVKIKDEHGAESGWTTLDVTMPKNFGFTPPFLTWLFHMFPNAFSFLRYFLGI